jgi:hypothetical protein
MSSDRRLGLLLANILGAGGCRPAVIDKFRPDVLMRGR